MIKFIVNDNNMNVIDEFVCDLDEYNFYKLFLDNSFIIIEKDVDIGINENNEMYEIYNYIILCDKERYYFSKVNFRVNVKPKMKREEMNKIIKSIKEKNKINEITILLLKYKLDILSNGCKENLIYDKIQKIVFSCYGRYLTEREFNNLEIKIFKKYL